MRDKPWPRYRSFGEMMFRFTQIRGLPFGSFIELWYRLRLHSVDEQLAAFKQLIDVIAERYEVHWNVARDSTQHVELRRSHCRVEQIVAVRVADERDQRCLWPQRSNRETWRGSCSVAEHVDYLQWQWRVSKPVSALEVEVTLVVSRVRAGSSSEDPKSARTESGHMVSLG